MDRFNGINLQDVFYSAQQLRENGRELAGKSRHDWQKCLFSFSYAWLNGKTSFVVQTSGSTGTPKEITLTREQMKASARGTGRMLNLSHGDVSLMCLSARYIAGIMMLVRAIELGLQITVTEPVSNPFRPEFVRDQMFDFTALVPLQLQTILDDGDRDCLERMKAVLVGGADISPRLVNELKNLSCPVYQTFGMTETATHIAVRRLDGLNPTPYYTVLDGITIGMDERNCLTVQGAVTNNRKLVSNDIIEMVPGDQFRWLGRLDNVINSGGIKIFPEALEARIQKIVSTGSRHETAVMIFGLPDERLGERVAVVFERPELSGEFIEQMHIRFQQHFDKYERPLTIYNLAEFIYQPNGKIDRRRTRALLLFER
jgi:O-succinylbenzoic acid--CoA ligase